MRSTVVAVIAACICAPGFGQTADSLPASLSGTWVAQGPSRAYINKVSLVFDSSTVPGKVSGRVTWNGVSCGAKDEPFSGTWDGTELRIDTTHRANVNTQSMDGQCGNGHAIYLLKRVPATTKFEGTAQIEGLPTVATVTLSP